MSSQYGELQPTSDWDLFKKCVNVFYKRLGLYIFTRIYTIRYDTIRYDTIYDKMLLFESSALQPFQFLMQTIRLFSKF